MSNDLHIFECVIIISELRIKRLHRRDQYGPQKSG